MKYLEEERELLTRIAWMYYFGGMNQQEIAEEFEFSRIKVTRLLKLALDSGIVHISIADSHFSLFSMEDTLKKVSGLQYVVVVPSLPDLADALSRGTAHVCNDIIGMKGTLGIGLSRSLRFLNSYLDKEKCRISSVVSICGTASPNLALTPLNVGLHVAQALDVDFYTIWAPVVVGRGVHGMAMRQDPYISMVLEMAKNVDYAIVGIGNVDDSQLIDMKYISDEDYQEITASKVEGEILGRYFTIDGVRKPTNIDERIISVDFPMKCPVIAAAGGLSKARAIVAAIRSGYIQGLVTDEKAAAAIVEIMGKQSIQN